MKRRYRRARPHRRKSSIMASNWGPVLALSGSVLGILGAIALVVFVLLPVLMPLLGVSYTPPFTPRATPTIAPRPTPTPRPIETADVAQLQHEVVFSGSTAYTWLGDPYFYDGTLVFTAGQLVENQACMNAMFYYDPVTEEAEETGASLKNDHFMFPVFNDNWLVYLDAKAGGGGLIQAVSRQDGKTFTVKDVYVGQPELKLDGDYLAWTERTGSRMDKLFVCDLKTLETTTVQMFSGSSYGQSLPSLRDGLLLWADSGDRDDESVIQSILLTESTINSYEPETYVHDPESNGVCTAWLDGHHSPETSLYFCLFQGAPVLVDTGVVEFGLGSDFIVYGKEDHIYVYFYRNRKSYMLTPERESAQFLGVSDDYVLWMDVTSRERDILKYAHID